jgi:hypothetical protein
VNYLRFTRREYRALCTLSTSLGSSQYSAHALRRLLASSLADTWPELAARINRLNKSQLAILYDHLLQFRMPENKPSLCPEEVEFLVATAGPLLFQIRFVGPLKAALIKALRQTHPELADKLACLTTSEFQLACGRAR